MLEYVTFIIRSYNVSRLYFLLHQLTHFMYFCTLLLAGVVRFFRKVVAMRDDFYDRYIVKGNLFKPLVDLFMANGTKYNLLNSALIELFEYIRIVSTHTLSP